MNTTITYYQLYCPSNKQGKEEVLCECLDLVKAKFRYEEALKGKYDKVWRSAKPPFKIRIMEADYDLESKPMVF